MTCRFYHSNIAPLTTFICFPPPTSLNLATTNLFSVCMCSLCFCFHVDWTWEHLVCRSVSTFLSIMFSRFVSVTGYCERCSSELGSASLFLRECFCVFKKIFDRAITGSHGSCVYYFQEPPYCLPLWLHQCTFPPTAHWVPHLHMLDHTWYLSLGQMPFQKLWQLTPVLTYSSLMTISDAEQLFLCLFPTCMLSLESIYSLILPVFYLVFV